MRLISKFTLAASLSTFFAAAILSSCASKAGTPQYLLAFTDENSQKCGFKTPKGEIVKPASYDFCSGDTLRHYAIVLIKGKFTAIDINFEPMYEVFTFDNGPDYIAEGLFRIKKDNKIGFADGETGKIIIAPQFDCAYPFEGGKAQVSKNCSTKPNGEYMEWISDNWEYIDKSGKASAE
jgi:hypothetical protein